LHAMVNKLFWSGVLMGSYHGKQKNSYAWTQTSQEHLWDGSNEELTLEDWKRDFMFPHKRCLWRLDEDARSQHSHSLDDIKIVYKAPQPAAPPYSVTRTSCRRHILHALGPAGQQKKGSAGHSNTHFYKCMNYELQFRQSFAKLRRRWSSNYAGKGGSRRGE
jgi:hypothetical protein